MTVRILCLMMAVSSAVQAQWYILPGTLMSSSEVVWAIPGARRTACAPVRIEEGQVVAMSWADTANAAITLEAVRREAVANADKLLASLPVTYVRDKRGVVEYAEISSKNPLTASCVFAAGFQEKFLETIGPDVAVAFPNRYTVYVFPRSMVPTGALSERMFVDYHATSYGVSREIFDFSTSGLRAVGEMK